MNKYYIIKYRLKNCFRMKLLDFVNYVLQTYKSSGTDFVIRYWGFICL